jgi:uncharacterized protein (TIGR02453 family)
MGVFPPPTPVSDRYFTPATFRFLRDLAAHNNRTWFNDHKPRYEETVRQPFLRLISDLAVPLARISPHYRADSRPQGGSLFRIHRDTRYARDKTPYKTWAGARLAHERRREVEAPAFYLHIEPGGCFVGAGLWHPEPATLKRLRAFLADNPAAWTRATRGKAFRERFGFHGESLKRPPHGFDPGHVLIEDLKRRSFAAGRGFDDALACSEELRPFAVDSFRRLAPMVDYLCAALDLPF